MYYSVTDVLTTNVTHVYAYENNCAWNDCPKQNLKYGVWLTRGHVHCHADATGVTLMNEGCVLNNNNTVQLSIEWFT